MSSLHVAPTSTEQTRRRRGRFPQVDLASRREGYPDGAWCPRSRNLAAELPALIADLREQGLRVKRVSYNPALWNPAPRRIIADSVPIDLGRAASFYPHLLRFFLAGDDEHIDVLVMFPAKDTEATAAPDLGLADRARVQVWESEGGRLGSSGRTATSMASRFGRRAGAR